MPISMRETFCWDVRCRKFKITVKFFFGFFCTWLDRGHESDYKKVVLNFSKYIFGRKKFKMAEYRIFCEKQVNFGNDAIFLFSHYLYFSKPTFSCSLCKTNYRKLYLTLFKNNMTKQMLPQSGSLTHDYLLSRKPI